MAEHGVSDTANKGNEATFGPPKRRPTPKEMVIDYMETKFDGDIHPAFDTTGKIYDGDAGKWRRKDSWQ